MGDWADMEQHYEDMRQLDEALGFSKSHDEFLDALETLNEKDEKK